MKLADVLTLAAPFLASDKKPEDLRKAILAADKKAKDAAGSGLGARELEEKDQPKAQDEREQAEDEMMEAADARAEAEDEKAEKADNDNDADDKRAKDRKTARDARKVARDARRVARDARRVARDARAKDRNNDPEHTNPGGADEDYTEGANPTTPGGSRANGKTAIDSAEVDRRIAAAVRSRDELHAARAAVEPIIGVVALDSAGAVYRAALDKLAIDHNGIPDSALPAMLRLAKDNAAARNNGAAPAAIDSAGVSALEKVIPGYGRLR